MGNRKRVLVLMDTFDEYCQSEIWNGIVASARKNGVDLLTLPLAFQGKYDHIYTHYFFIGEFLQTEIYDAIISFTGGLSEHTSPITLKALFLKATAPIISVAGELRRTCDIVVDNKPGVIDIVNHFIKDHNSTRIAFVGGPKSNSEAKERLSAYKDGLEKNNIPFDEELVFEGNFSEECGMKAVQSLISNGIKFDSLIGADDYTALGAIKEMKNNGISVPNDVIVSGFDDAEVAQYSSPSLTTIQQPFFALGSRALEASLEAIDGVELNAKEVFDTSAVVRESCSCCTGEITTLLENKNTIEDKLWGISSCDEELYNSTILPAIEKALKLYKHQTPDELDKYKEFINLHTCFLWNSYILAEKNKMNCKAFLLTFTGILNNQLEYQDDYSVWDYSLIVFATLVGKLVNNKELQNILNNMIREAHAIFEKHQIRITKQETIVSDEFGVALRELSQHIIHCKSKTELYSTLKYECEQFEFSSFNVVLYETPSRDGFVNTPCVSFTFQNGEEISGPTGALYDNSILPIAIDEKMETIDNKMWLPLVFEEVYYGYILISSDSKFPKYIYEDIRNHLSIALAILVRK